MTLSAEQRQALLIRLLTEYMLHQHTQGQLLKYLRKNVLNVNQTKYAAMTGVSRKTLSDIELDKGKPVQSIVDKVFMPFGLKAGVVPIHMHIARELVKENDLEK
ncbi:MAG: helix-turn-helix domain-containing protein [Granulosicoccus sp.]